MKHFIDINDISAAELAQLLSLASELKAARKAGTAKPLLAGKTLGMIFAKSSTRTRVSFEVGMVQLGGYPVILNTADIQLGRGETIADTAQVLSRYLDAVMIRTFAHQDVLDLAQYGTIPIINGLTDLMHPCQALADLLTVQEHFGHLAGLKLAYLGDGNNVANSLLQACSKAGMHIAVASPSGYTCDPGCIAQAQSEAAKNGTDVLLTDDPYLAVAGAAVVYTDTWVSMGQEAEKARRIPIFGAYQVNGKIMAAAEKDAIFLHCLPAYRDLEVTAEVIDGPASKAIDQAENRLHAQKAILVSLLARLESQARRMTLHHQEIAIRQAVPEDAPEIHALVQKAMAVYARNSGITTPLESQLETVEDHIAHILADHVLVAERHGHLIGAVRLIHGEDDTAYFSRFTVTPTLQRSGVGKLLYQAAETWLKSRGVRSVLLHTALTNQPLVDFYVARGFHLIKESTGRGYPRGTFLKNL